MRFHQIFEQLQEGIPMGQKALSSKPQMNYTIGFEFEVAVSPDAPTDYNSNDQDDFEDWYDNNNNFDREDVVNDYFIYNEEVKDFVNDNSLTPRFGEVQFDDYQKITDKKMKDTFGDDYDKVLDLITYDDEIRNMTYFDKKSKEELLQNALLIVGLEKRYIAKDPKTEEEITTAFNKVAENELPTILRGHYVRLDNFVNDGTDEEEYGENPRIYVNKERTRYTELEDFSGFEELITYFNITKDEVYEILEDYISQEESEYRDNLYNEWQQDRAPSLDQIAYVMNRLEEEMGISATGYADINNWAVVGDETDGVDAEIVSPVFDLAEGLQVLKDIFEFIEDDSYIYTTQACGLHVNIGTWKGNDINNIDLLKFLTILNAKGILKDFDRVSNRFTRDKYAEIVQSILSPNRVGLDIKDYNEFINDMNHDILRGAKKFEAVNFSKLENLGYIELRAMGNTDYESKYDVARNNILKFIRSMDIAQNPNAFRNEYFKKLSKFFIKDEYKENELQKFVFDVIGSYSTFYYVLDKLLRVDPKELDKHYTRQVFLQLQKDLNDHWVGRRTIEGITKEVENLSDEDLEKVKQSRFGRHMLKIAKFKKL